MARPIFALAALNYDISKCSNVHAYRIKKFWGYVVKMNGHKSLNEFKKAIKCIVEHLFDNHEYCDPQWCKRKRIDKYNKNLPPGKDPLLYPSGFYRCKVKFFKLYNQINECIIEKVTIHVLLIQCLHQYSTQRNEGMNTSVKKYARKGRTDGTSMSLNSQVMIFLSILNKCYHIFWGDIFETLSFDMSPEFNKFLGNKDSKKKRKNEYESRRDIKIKRAKKNNDKIKKEAEKVMRDIKRGSTYGAGVAIETNEKLPFEVTKMEEQKKKLKSQICPFPGCLGRNHTTTKSRECKYHACTGREELDKEIETYLHETYPDYFGGETEISILLFFVF